MSVAVVDTAPVQVIEDEPVSLFQLSVEQYHEMIHHGILTDDDAVELLEGVLVRKMPKNPAHSFSTRTIRKALEQVISKDWSVDCQEPITTADSEPEPDLAVVRSRETGYQDRHPQPADVALVIEVSDTTLQRDRGSKKRLYASALIPAYWIVNLSAGQIEAYSQPSGSAVNVADYATRTTYQRNDSIPVLIDGQEIAQLRVVDLLPATDSSATA